MEETIAMVLEFTRACNHLEQYIHKGGVLTAVQEQTVLAAVMTLSTFLSVSKNKAKDSEKP